MQLKITQMANTGTYVTEILTDRKYIIYLAKKENIFWF